MGSEKDSQQDELIRKNSERIERNEEAIKRQTEALEKIRDHYYPRQNARKKFFKFVARLFCAVFAYLGIAETVDWIWNVREADALAEKYAAAGHRLFYGEGDPYGAVRCYEKAAELNPKESEYVIAIAFMRGMSVAKDFIWSGRSLTDEERVRVDVALADAAVLKEVNPKNPMPYVLMSQALFLSGEKEDAVEAVERAVACAPANASVRISACAIQYFAGHAEAARTHLAEAERLDPTLSLMMVWKGMIALSVDHDAETAKRCFEALIRRSPRLPIAHAMLGRALLAGAKPDVKAARAAFARALVLDARHVIAMLGMAETCERDANPIAARMWYDRMLSQDRRNMSALLARARINVKLGDVKAAENDFSAALDLEPFRFDIFRERAKLREAAGNAEAAAEDRACADAVERMNAER